MLNEMKIEFLVAPFEADSHLAFLSRTGAVDVVLSDDGDMLVVYRCRVLLSKFAEKKGTVQELGWGHIRRGLNKTIFENFDGEDCYQKMVEVCILAGGDYLPSIEGIGIRTSFKRLIEHGSVEKVRCFCLNLYHVQVYVLTICLSARMCRWWRSGLPRAKWSRKITC